jgi:hypothetical protein
MSKNRIFWIAWYSDNGLYTAYAYVAAFKNTDLDIYHSKCKIWIFTHQCIKVLKFWIFTYQYTIKIVTWQKRSSCLFLFLYLREKKRFEENLHGFVKMTRSFKIPCNCLIVNILMAKYPNRNILKGTSEFSFLACPFSITLMFRFHECNRPSMFRFHARADVEFW